MAAALILLLTSPVLLGSQFFIALIGNNSNPGTADQPFASLSRAASLMSTTIKPGDTIWVKGGTYPETSTISISKSGTPSLMYNIWAWPGERALLDYSAQAFGSTAVKLSGSYCYIKGIDIKGSGDNGMNVSGSYNIIENCTFFENRDSGLQLSGGASNNKVINCDSYYNADPPDYGDADGFAVKMDVGTGNYFYGCRSWLNVDDGWDGYLRGADNVSTSVNNCWAFKNGYFKNGADGGANANGNGFKMGGSDLKDLKHDFKVTNCLAFMNKAKGFDQNNNKGSMVLYNCTGYANAGYNFSIPSALASGKTAVIKNSIELGGRISLGSFVQQSSVSWQMTPAASASDFVSIDTSLLAQATAPRKSDGSLPDISFMHLIPGSRYIDIGESVGLLFNGSAPDLGCFETGKTLGVEVSKENEIKSYRILSNYPNPFNPATRILINLRKDGPVTLKIYDINGQEINSLLNEYKIAGSYSVTWNAPRLASGVYFCRLFSDGQISSIKMILAK
ncbi:MAG: right-handed parallel beta-helix repeat-containing protein [Syntrophothermus sp.]